MKLKALLIDDEPAALTTLTVMLTKFCKGVEIVGAATNAGDALALIAEHKPDVLFLDIEIQELNGFDLLNKLSDVKPVIVFVTAHEQYAIQAIKKGARDYLLKPIHPDELNETVESIRRDLANKWSGGGEKKLIYLNAGSTVKVLSMEEILYIKGEGRYSEFYCLDSRKIVICKNLGEYEDELVPLGFFRTHKSVIVNMSYVSSFGKTENSVKMKNGIVLPLSRRKKMELVQVIGRAAS